MSVWGTAVGCCCVCCCCRWAFVSLGAALAASASLSACVRCCQDAAVVAPSAARQPALGRPYACAGSAAAATLRHTVCRRRHGCCSIVRLVHTRHPPIVVLLRFIPIGQAKQLLCAVQPAFVADEPTCWITARHACRGGQAAAIPGLTLHTAVAAIACRAGAWPQPMCRYPIIMTDCDRLNWAQSGVSRWDDDPSFLDFSPLLPFASVAVHRMLGDEMRKIKIHPRPGLLPNPFKACDR